MRSTFLPYCLPSIGDEEAEEVGSVLRTGWLTTGPKVRQFEEEFAAYVGAKHAIAVNSCTAALHVSLAALGIGPGDEVIVPTMTFCATANVVLHLGATVVLVDVLADGRIDPSAVEKAITGRTKAIVPVHYAGAAADLDAIQELARRRGIAVIEDAAHAVGTPYKGKLVGSHGTAVCFSFYATKNMTTGEGGMVTTNDPELADRIRTLSLHGMTHNAWNRYTKAGSWRYDVVDAGYKYNMGEIQAALGIVQLRRLPSFIERRRAIAQRYREQLDSIPGLTLPDDLGGDHIYHLYPVWIDEAVTGISREDFIERLKEANIGTSVHFIPLHRHPLYRRLGHTDDAFPVAERMFRGLLSLPLYPAMTEQDVNDVIAAVQSILSSRPISVPVDELFEVNPA